MYVFEFEEFGVFVGYIWGKVEIRGCGRVLLFGGIDVYLVLLVSFENWRELGFFGKDLGFLILIFILGLVFIFFCVLGKVIDFFWVFGKREVRIWSFVFFGFERVGFLVFVFLERGLVDKDRESIGVVSLVFVESFLE